MHGSLTKQPQFGEARSMANWQYALNEPLPSTQRASDLYAQMHHQLSKASALAVSMHGRFVLRCMQQEYVRAYMESYRLLFMGAAFSSLASFQSPC